MNYLVKLAVLALMATSVALAATTEEGKAFLAANKEKEGVIVHKDGLQYRVLKSGPKDGKSPEPNTQCMVHYHGKTINGVTFDSSLDRGEPLAFAPNQVIEGWKIALQMMKPGDIWEVVIPSEMAYGDNKVTEEITPGSVLVFEIRLLSVGTLENEL